MSKYLPINDSFAETYRLSGSNIYLTVPVEDSTQALHAHMLTETKAIKDSANSTDINVNKIPSSTGTQTWNTTAKQTIQDEAADALEAEFLDKLLGSAVSGDFSSTILDDAVIGYLLVKSGTTNYDRTTMSLQALSEAIAAVKDTTSGAHDNLLDFIQAAIDTASNAHNNLLDFIQAGIDTTENTHAHMVDYLEDFTAGVLVETTAAPVTMTATTTNTCILAFDTADTRYLVRSLRLKAADPGANTITITLYELINDAQTAVDTFAITTGNYTTYFSLYDMFGVQQLAGDKIWINAQTDAGSYAITGQCSYAKTK